MSSQTVNNASSKNKRDLIKIDGDHDSNGLNKKIKTILVAVKNNENNDLNSNAKNGSDIKNYEETESISNLGKNATKIVSRYLRFCFYFLFEPIFKF
jgi:hypothetical protein